LVKAASWSCAGFPTIGLSGCSAGAHNAQLRRDTHRQRTELHPTLAQNVSWQGRPAIIVMDSDAHENERVRNGENIAALALSQAGAKVSIARIPQHEGR